MVSLCVSLLRLVAGIARGVFDPEFRAMLLALLLIVLGGTLFYRQAEAWSWLDAAYFSLMTLVTIAPPGLAPTSDLSKIFTMIYVLAGFGVMIGFVTRLALHIAKVPAVSANAPAQGEPAGGASVRHPSS